MKTQKNTAKIDTTHLRQGIEMETQSNQNNDSQENSATPASVKSRLGSIWRGTANICGVLALIITVSWQFPSEVVGMYFQNQEQKRNEIRQAISAMASEVREAVNTANSVGADPQMKMINTSVFTVKMNYEFDKISKYDDSVFEQATYFENVTIAGLGYIIQRYDVSNRFYGIAIRLADRDKLDAINARVGRANTNMALGGIQELAQSRLDFKWALDSARKKSVELPSQFGTSPLQVMIEIAMSEMRFGDYDCGKKIADIVNAEFNKPANMSPPIQATAMVFRSQIAQIPIRSGQVGTSCAYLD